MQARRRNVASRNAQINYNNSSMPDFIIKVNTPPCIIIIFRTFAFTITKEKEKRSFMKSKTNP